MSGRIRHGDIKVGVALPWPIYDETGRLLLKQGYIIENEEQMAALIAKGLYKDRAAAQNESQARHYVEKRSPFDRLDDITQRFERLSMRLKFHPVPELAELIDGMVAEFRDIAAHDTDAAFGNLHLFNEAGYPFLHPVKTAVLAYLLALHLKLDSAAALATTSAALTMNISMIDLQRTLFNQQGALSEQQTQELRSHPLRSVEMLQNSGITERVWLGAVAQHHENFDGSGYPAGLAGDKIGLEARIITVCDSYCSMISPRAYRAALLPTLALRTLYQAGGSRLDAAVCVGLVKLLGVNPPGSLVRLANGEISVVTHRDVGEGIVAQSILNPQGRAFNVPMKRHCSKKDHTIQELLPLEKCDVPINRNRVWGYAA